MWILLNVFSRLPRLYGAAQNKSGIYFVRRIDAKARLCNLLMYENVFGISVHLQKREVIGFEYLCNNCRWGNRRIIFTMRISI